MEISYPSSPQAPANHYDVYVSFGGFSTLSAFVFSLFDALFKKDITPITGHQWKGEVNISSHISIIIFSEDYAGSEWCLTELKILMEGKRSNRHIVIPVFYEVDPSDVNYLTGKFGAAHARLKERLREAQMLDLGNIGDNLKEAVSIAGWQSSLRDNSDLIQNIAVDILDKLDQVRLRLNYPSIASLVGIASPVERIETMLRHLRVVQIDGPSGVGKTTIAKVVIHHISARFDAFYFVNNEVSMDEIFPQVVAGQLRDKKILIVLDDFGERDLVATLLRNLSGFSKILVISKDAQMLQNVPHETYKVEGLNKYNARRLFCLNAFNRNNEPTEDRVQLSESVLEVAVGNPLALVVLGCALFGMSTEEEKKWLDEFNRLKGRLYYSDLQSLKKEPIFVQKMLRISYDTLKDDEKKIFLQMPYFIGEDLEDVLKHFGGLVRPIVITLKDKSLITISSNKIEMHELLKEMAYSMDSRGSPAVPPEVVLKYVFPFTNLALEIVVLALEIIGSAQKPLYSLIGLIVALSAMMVFFCELVYKGWHRNITLKWNGRGWWEMKRQPLDNRPFLSWSDAFSLLCAICQLVSTTVGYIYSRKHKENPFRLSLVSLIYIICMGASQLVNKSIDDVLFSMKRNE